jgi:nitrogen fixation NifU-like protein
MSGRSEVDALYQAVIVEHSKHPRRHGPLPEATHQAALDNPLCGDAVTVQLVVGAGGVIADARHHGHGCALSIAAASVLCERLVGTTVGDARALIDRFERVVTPDAEVPDELGELTAFVGVRQFRSRRTCATLPFRALAQALG